MYILTYVYIQYVWSLGKCKTHNIRTNVICIYNIIIHVDIRTIHTYYHVIHRLCVIQIHIHAYTHNVIYYVRTNTHIHMDILYVEHHSSNNDPLYKCTQHCFRILSWNICGGNLWYFPHQLFISVSQVCEVIEILFRGTSQLWEEPHIQVSLPDKTLCVYPGFPYQIYPGFPHQIKTCVYTQVSQTR